MAHRPGGSRRKTGLQDGTKRDGRSTLLRERISLDICIVAGHSCRTAYGSSGRVPFGTARGDSVLLTKAQVTNFKSIDDSSPVNVDPKVTVLVGQNEAGKTCTLQAVEKSRPIRSGVAFDVTEDYPRKGLNEYMRRQASKPAVAVTLTFELDSEEVHRVHQAFGAPVLRTPTFTMTYDYAGNSVVSLDVDESAFVRVAVAGARLSPDIATTCNAAGTVRELLACLGTADLNSEAQAFVDSLNARFKAGLDDPTWANLVEHEAWFEHIGEPGRFLYFGDYQLLPGKVNLQSLAGRAANPAQLTDEDQTVLRLLEMADVDLTDLTASTGYEAAKARLESLSNSITDQVFKFWTQNKQLDVEIDIRPDPADLDARFQTGPNLYVRIKNRRHRVTVPFNQRSKGFIWFFSFLVWFDSVRAEKSNAPIILLLDEPGLSLHALAQADLLRYIDDVSERHQVLYTTHSPFMVHGDRLHQVRLVEDREKVGTVVTDNVMGSDSKTLFPLQAALGYTVAQNLFISPRNLLVEGPADLIYLKYMSAQCEAAGRVSLREDVTVVPVGGLDKVATFIALLGANNLELAVLHDLAGKPDARLESLVHEKVIRERQILNYGMFRAATGESPGPTDVEDMFSVAFYVELFNKAFAKPLEKRSIAETDLQPGPRIVGRIERHLKDNAISVRPSPGFNHYAPASYLASHPSKADKATLERFENLFRSVNALFSA